MILLGAIGLMVMVDFLSMAIPLRFMALAHQWAVEASPSTISTLCSPTHCREKLPEWMSNLISCELNSKSSFPERIRSSVGAASRCCPASMSHSLSASINACEIS